MNIQSISAQQSCEPKPAFKSATVTLSEKNLGKMIATDVVDSFSHKILPQIQKTVKAEAAEIIKKAGGPGKVIAKPEDFQNKVEFFALAAGAGSRFAKLAEVVGNYNKISLPFRINKDLDLHMLDFAMGMSKFCIDDAGVSKIIAPKKSGSFGDIVKHYLDGAPIKDTIVCCGDNVFGDSAAELMTFFTKVMNNPDKHLALVGAKRTPGEVLETFGLLGVEGSLNDESLKLTSFVEKPKQLEIANKCAIEGQCIANTGLFYISKEAMEKLMAEIESGINNIKKNDSEPYDFAAAVEYVHKMTPEWFGIESKEAADVKVVKKWEDVGQPKALYQFAEDVKNGEYLKNFPKNLADEIVSSFKKRIHTKDAVPYINFTNADSVSAEQISKAKNIEGVNIVV